MSGKLATQEISDPVISPMRKPNTKWVIGYFGQLEAKYRGLEDVINLTIQTPEMEFWIAGVGELRSLILEVEKSCNRVKFLGSYSQDNLPALTSDVDIYTGLYYSEKHLHKYAVPNKYYEHLYLGIPILTSTKTPFARGIQENRTGWAIEDGPMAMVEWFGDLNKDDLVKMRANCQEQWQKKYDNYYGQLKLEFDKIWPSIN
jgi:glycosyltransferase involved in cell wall biosynthesis